MSDESTTNVPERACLNHCGHDPKWFDPKTGKCWALVMPSYTTIKRPCGHVCQASPRICQRGVDDAEGCGHPETISKNERIICEFWLEDEQRPCGHACRDFSLSPHEAKVEDDSTFYCPVHSARYEMFCTTCKSAPPMEDGTHKFRPVPASTTCVEIIEEADCDSSERYCGQPQSAPVHKVAPRFGSAAGQVEMAADFDASTELVESPPGLVYKVSEPSSCPGCEAAHAGVQGWADRHTEQCKADHASPTVEPPARVWIAPISLKWKMNREMNVYDTANHEDADIEYVHPEPIRAALAKCEAYKASSQAIDFGPCVVLRKSDWVALVKSVKGEK